MFAILQKCTFLLFYQRWLFNEKLFFIFLLESTLFLTQELFLNNCTTPYLVKNRKTSYAYSPPHSRKCIVEQMKYPTLGYSMYNRVCSVTKWGYYINCQRGWLFYCNCIVNIKLCLMLFFVLLAELSKSMCG